MDAEHITAQLRERFDLAHEPAAFIRAQCTACAELGAQIREGGPLPETIFREVYEVVLRHLGIVERHAEVAAWLRQQLKAEVLWRRPVERAADVLEQLRARGYLVAAISNSDGRAEQSLQLAGLREHFDFVVDSHLVGFEKPHPEIFRIGVERAGVAAAEAVYVGDIPPIDVIGSRRAGLQPVLHDPFDLSPNVDCVRIRALDELLEVLPC